MRLSNYRSVDVPLLTDDCASAPPGPGPAETQRQRWEGGHLRIIAADTLPLIWEAIMSGNRDLLFLALDLAVLLLTFLASHVVSTVRARGGRFRRGPIVSAAHKQQHLPLIAFCSRGCGLLV